MSLASYILSSFEDEESIIKELLNIDNKVCMTDLTYEDLYEQFNNTTPLLDVKERCVMLTDGDPDTVYASLINNALNIVSLHIDNSFLGINKWLVSKTYSYYFEKGIEINLKLDEDNGYVKYKNVPYKVVIYGFDDFALGTKELFDGHDKLVISK